MQGKRTVDYVQKLCAEKGLPYLDVRMYKGYEEIFAYGLANEETPTGRERLHLYSATKPMTVVCAMRLVEEGKLCLDDLVEKYLPAYANAFLLNENGEPTPTKMRMTVRHLLTMSGGLTYNVTTKPIQELLQKTNGKADTEAMVSAFVETPLLFEPGERFEYSLCHDVLAAVVEKASGKRFSAYMQELIFDPLGMSDSGFHREKEGMYDKYDCNERGEIRQVPPVNSLVFGENYDSGGAGVISTVDDYVKFAVALANGGVGGNGSRLLQEDTLKRITTQCSDMGIDNTFTCIQGSEYAYGLGVRVRKQDTPWGLDSGEFGWDGAAGTYLMVDPKKKISVVIGMHLLSWPYVFVGEHLQIVKCLYEDLLDEGLF
jgi:CubicO group peptidase (beta-lactamase class C family)